MKLFMVSIFSSAASTNARIAAEAMPCFSALLRGSVLDAPSAATQTNRAHKSNNSESVVFMIFTNELDSVRLKASGAGDCINDSGTRDGRIQSSKQSLWLRRLED
jgi:hypothetical protein